MTPGLRKLAKLVFTMTRREIWLGGKVTKDSGLAGWPEGLETPFRPLVGWYFDTKKKDAHGAKVFKWHTEWAEEWFWTLSPEVELAGHRLRVCVSSGDGNYHDVTVFVDGERKHPGGHYRCEDFWWWHRWPWPRWSTRIADLERTDGGRPGPVDRRDLLIEAAEKKISEKPDSSRRGQLSEASKEHS